MAGILTGLTGSSTFNLVEGKSLSEMWDDFINYPIPDLLVIFGGGFAFAYFFKKKNGKMGEKS
jgi:hypothetical protein